MGVVAVGVLFRAGCRYRERAMPLVMDAYRRAVPEARVFVADTGHATFNRAASRNMVVEEAGEGVVVIADADILPDLAALRSAINAAADGGMHLGYTRYRALLRESTERVYRTDVDPVRLPAAYESGESTCGVVVIRCDEWRKAGGMDERFDGWGFEDTAFASAVRTILGPITYHEGTVNHLWHPSAVRIHANQYRRNKDLCARYQAAEGSVPEMLRIMDEDRSCSA